MVGSPPRMRGKLFASSFVAAILRITPAHAGKTRELVDFGHAPADHPRACGENTSEMAYFRG